MPLSIWLTGLTALGERWRASCAQEIDCWHGDFNAERCCGGEHPECWDSVYTSKKCCPEEMVAPRGNPICWFDGYDYDTCCGEEPKEGCWDDEFGPERCCVDSSEPLAPVSGPIDVLREEHDTAYARVMAGVHDTPLGCVDDSPPGLWPFIKFVSMSLNVSHAFGMPGVMQPLEVAIDAARLWIRDPAAWRAAKAACPQGALNTIDLCAARLEKDFGIQVARDAYRLHAGLVQELGNQGKWPLEVDGWPVLAGMFDYAPKLLGLGPRHSCLGSSLKLYMYGGIEKIAHMTSPVLACSQKMPMCAASVHIHRWLQHSSCLTEDADQADIFWVPTYESCYNESACGYGNASGRCFPQDLDLANDLPYFARRRGADHVFTFGCNLLPFADPLMIQARHSMMVTVEAFQAESIDGPPMLAWLSHWKDVIIPGYIAPWRIDAMLSFNRPVLQRNILLTFHGHSRRSKDRVGAMYKISPLAVVRERLIENLFNASACSVGPPVPDYFRRMGKSKFCLIPAGLTAWTIHLYEAFFFGCVPVILSDELTVPFQKEIDWPSLSIQFPTNISMDDLRESLAAFRIGRLKRMYRALAAARCWFDYSRGWGEEGFDPKGCSPYRGLLTALEERVRLRDTLYPLPAFWSPPPDTD